MEQVNNTSDKLIEKPQITTDHSVKAINKEQ